MIEIQKNIPVPVIKSGRKLKFPFDKMEVGDSFEVDNAADRNNASGAARLWAKRHKNKVTFATCEVEGGKYRIWRTK